MKRVLENGVERMNVLQDVRTAYDLGDNPTEVQFYDDEGWAFTETRTYARGYQLTGFSTQADPAVTVVTAGSYTYDTNNNMTATKKLDATRGGTTLAYRGQWTFTFDRKNRLKSHTNTNANSKQTYLWYDGMGRVWQRWQYDTNSSEWDSTLTRYVYDGAQLVQEHSFGATGNGSWTYSYTDLSRDYLRHPAGLRQREGSVSSHTDYFIQSNVGSLEFKTERDPASEAITRAERSSSLDQISGATFNNISHLATSGSYIESFGGGTSGSCGGFDPLLLVECRHYSTAIGRSLDRELNNPYLIFVLLMITIALLVFIHGDKPIRGEEPVQQEGEAELPRAGIETEQEYPQDTALTEQVVHP